MPAKWTSEEKGKHFKILHKLYVQENKTMREIGKILGNAEQTIYKRLLRVGIKTQPELKPGYLLFKERSDVKIPQNYTPDLAEFFGIMLGDGRLSNYQVAVTLGTKELAYANYVVSLIEKIFSVRPKIAVRKKSKFDNKYRDIYLGSVAVTKWLRSEGLVFNKVAAQVDVPNWLFENEEFSKRFIRGFFDTDGSIYKLRWGCQISFNNKSLPLLKSTINLLLSLSYNPSKISGWSVYLTRKKDIEKFFSEIKPKNTKHLERFSRFRAGT